MAMHVTEKFIEIESSLMIEKYELPPGKKFVPNSEPVKKKHLFRVVSSQVDEIGDIKDEDESSSGEEGGSEDQGGGSTEV